MPVLDYEIKITPWGISKAKFGRIYSDNKNQVEMIINKSLQVIDDIKLESEKLSEESREEFLKDELRKIESRRESPSAAQG